jgi:hypothetical protein
MNENPPKNTSENCRKRKMWGAKGFGTRLRRKISL